MEVDVDVDRTELEDEHGRPVDGITVTCSRCGHQVEVFGTGIDSVKRGCAMLHEECPFGERNFYIGVAPAEPTPALHLRRKPQLEIPLLPSPILFFDTETTGLPRYYDAPAANVDNWPRLVQLAWVVSTGPEVSEAFSYIVKPDGFRIPDDAARVHGIATERALAEGVPVAEALGAFCEDVQKVGTLVAHNMRFDAPVVGAELLRGGYDNLLDDYPKICTMRCATDFCRIPQRGRGGYKWPKLMELHQRLFGCGFEGAHDARNDVAAGARCYWELKKRGVL